MKASEPAYVIIRRGHRTLGRALSCAHPWHVVAILFGTAEEATACMPDGDEWEVARVEVVFGEGVTP